MAALYVLGSRPSSWSQPSLVCQVVMPWTWPEGEGWRASKSPESRCSGTPPPFNVQVVDMENKRCRGPATNNQAWWVERLTINKHKRDTCRWVWPERLGDDAARGAPPTR